MGIADEFLFDSSAMEKSSIFNWSYLKNIEINEWFLAGGNLMFRSPDWLVSTGFNSVTKPLIWRAITCRPMFGLF